MSCRRAYGARCVNACVCVVRLRGAEHIPNSVPPTPPPNRPAFPCSLGLAIYKVYKEIESNRELGTQQNTSAKYNATQFILGHASNRASRTTTAAKCTDAISFSLCVCVGAFNDVSLALRLIRLRDFYLLPRQSSCEPFIERRCVASK